MLYKFEKHIKNRFPEMLNQRLLVAISGGLDSVVLSFLLCKLKLDIVLAHCNFQLRGEESDEDEQFVRNFAKKMAVELQTIRFETEKFAVENKLNTQLAARELRYKWFEQVAENQKCSYVLTAHQADDCWETFLINLSRGTGLNGLSGIPEKNGMILRPMLPFSREEILQFARENAISWREDTSNASDKYVRNRIRHHISPKMTEIHRNFLNNFLKTQQILAQTEGFVSTQLQEFRYKYFQKEGDIIYFQTDEIRHHAQRDFIIFELMKPFGFLNLPDLLQLLKENSGRQLFSETHRLIQNRNQWIILPISVEKKEEIFEIQEDIKQIEKPISLFFSWETMPQKSENHTIYIDSDALVFPLRLRKWRESDFFIPFGMKNKKKLSKFFKDEKYSLLQKENQWILTDALDRIIWVVGKRADERFRVTLEIKKVLKVVLVI